MSRSVPYILLSPVEKPSGISMQIPNKWILAHDIFLLIGSGLLQQQNVLLMITALWKSGIYFSLYLRGKKKG